MALENGGIAITEMQKTVCQTQTNKYTRQRANNDCSHIHHTFVYKFPLENINITLGSSKLDILRCLSESNAKPTQVLMPEKKSKEGAAGSQITCI